MMIISTAYSNQEAKKKKRAADELIGKGEYIMKLNGDNLTSSNGMNEPIFPSGNGIEILWIGNKRFECWVDERKIMVNPGMGFEVNFILE